MLFCLFVQEVVKLTQREHARLAAIVGHSKNLKDVNEVFVLSLGFILDQSHLLEETIHVADEATTSGTLDVRIHLH
jgi:hypothetical protein